MTQMPHYPTHPQAAPAEGTLLPHHSEWRSQVDPPPPPPQAAKPPKQCAANLIKDVVQYYFFPPILSTEGVGFLMPRDRPFALLMEHEFVAPEIRRAVAQHVNRDVSDRQVKDVMTMLQDYLVKELPVPNRQPVYGGRTIKIGPGPGPGRYLFFDGAWRVLLPGEETIRDATFFPPCWQPANCDPYSTQGFHGFNAWRAESVMCLTRRMPVPEDRELLLVTFIVLSMLPECQQLALELTGEPDSGATRLMRTIKLYVDPCRRDVLVRRHPRTLKELDSLAWDHHVVALDNVAEPLPDKVQQRMFDFLNITTLDWRSRRRVMKPSFIHARRTWLFTAAIPVVTDSALRKRTLSLEMPSVGAEPSFFNMRSVGRASELTVDPRESEDIDLFTGLLALLGKVHAQLDDTRVYRKIPDGWQDFCRVGTLVAQALHGSDQEFWHQFEDYHHQRQREVIEEDPVAYAIFQYFLITEETSTLEKPVGKWMSLLEPYCPTWATGSNWPQEPRGMGAAFKRAAPLLKDHGFVCHSNGKRGSLCRWSIGPHAISARHF